jgi:uncharacterized membrane protein
VTFPASFAPTPASKSARARRRLLLLAVICIAVLPLVWRGPSCGQDFDFHLQNWLEVADHWHHGVLWPHWAVSANYLAGEPRFVFYPPLSWMTGAILGVILPWPWTGLVFTLIALLGAGFSFRAMARAWMPGANATFAACLYVVNPYMLFVAYERGALAELLAAVWMPLLVLFALREKPSFLPLSLTIAALWLTNAPAAVMGCYALAIVVAVAALQQRASPGKCWRLIARSVSAVVLGLALAGFWLVPAVYEERWVEIHRALAPLMRVEDSFLFGYAPLTGVSADERFDTVYHNQVLRTVSWIVVALIAGTALGAFFARKRRSPVWLPLAVAGALVCVLQLRFSDVLWRLAPKLQYLQFPWRWMMVLALIGAFFAGLALKTRAARRAVSIRALIVLAVAIGMTLLAALRFWQPCDEEDNVAAQIASFHATGFEGTDEYTPKGADNGAIPAGLPPILVLSSAQAELSTPDNPVEPPQPVPASVAIDRWSPEVYAATITTARPAFALFRLIDYPAWRITVNGTTLHNPPHRTDGLLAISLKPGTNRIDIRWHITADQWAGIALSLAAMVFTLLWAWKTTRRPRGNGIR